MLSRSDSLLFRMLVRPHNNLVDPQDFGVDRTLLSPISSMRIKLFEVRAVKVIALVDSSLSSADGNTYTAIPKTYGGRKSSQFRRIG